MKVSASAPALILVPVVQVKVNARAVPVMAPAEGPVPAPGPNDANTTVGDTTPVPVTLTVPLLVEHATPDEHDTAAIPAVTVTVDPVWLSVAGLKQVTSVTKVTVVRVTPVPCSRAHPEALTLIALPEFVAVSQGEAPRYWSPSINTVAVAAVPCTVRPLESCAPTMVTVPPLIVSVEEKTEFCIVAIEPGMLRVTAAANTICSKLNLTGSEEAPLRLIVTPEETAKPLHENRALAVAVMVVSKVMGVCTKQSRVP